MYIKGYSQNFASNIDYNMFKAEIPPPNEISNLKVSETEDFIRYSLAYKCRTHNNVATIIVHPRISTEPQIVGEESTKCKHEIIKNWVCESCGYKMQNYSNWLDFGEHLEYVEIMKNLEITFMFRTRIYQSYKYTTIAEAREYMMLILSNALAFYDSTYKVYEPKLSPRLEFYMKTRDDNWHFYAEHYLPFKVLKFESMFECGNLDNAELVDLDHYVLTVNPDTNTYGLTQWFYFAVTNTTCGRNVNFQIINFVKPQSLHTKGMPIWIFSKIRHEQTGLGWFQGGVNILYYENSYKRFTQSKLETTFYTLSFDYTFEHDNDKVYFAYSHPYPYTRSLYLIHQLEQSLIQKRAEEIAAFRNKFIQTDIENTDILDPTTPYPPFDPTIPFSLHEEKKRLNTSKISFTREIYARSLCGLPTYLITITGERKNGIVHSSERKCVFFTARVHPSETQSSFMAEGLLKYLLCIFVRIHIPNS